MQLWLQDKLPFTTVSIAYKGSAIDVPNVLIDTGSVGTIIAADIVAAIQNCSFTAARHTRRWRQRSCLYPLR